jgi:predicted RNA-binding Zn-ribbon protein involved in translation (DUF1610 family)
MHRLRHPSARTFHYLSSLAWLGSWVLVVYAVSLLVVALVKFDIMLAIRGSYWFAVVAFTAVLQRVCANAVKCPLCRMRPMIASRCQKNSKARPLFCSYRNKVALDTLTGNHFKCPYCGESTTVKAGQKVSGKSPEWR